MSRAIRKGTPNRESITTSSLVTQPTDKSDTPMTSMRATPTSHTEQNISVNPPSEVPSEVDLAVTEPETSDSHVPEVTKVVQGFRPFQSLFKTPIHLEFEDAQYLCQIHKLAHLLGTDNLEDTCTSRLYTVSWAEIDVAQAEGTSLLHLLSEPVEEESTRQQGGVLCNVLHHVFEYILEEDDPPAILNTLVIDILAKSAEIEAFKEVKPKIKPSLSNSLIETLMKNITAMRQQDAIKSESSGTNTGYENSEDDRYDTNRVN